MTDTKPWLLLPFCASLDLIPSKREADDLPVDNKRVGIGQEKFLPTSGVRVCCFRGCLAALVMARALCRLGKAGRQCVPFLRYSPGNAKEEAVTFKTAAALPGTRAS